MATPCITTRRSRLPWTASSRARSRCRWETEGPSSGRASGAPRPPGEWLRAGRCQSAGGGQLALHGGVPHTCQLCKQACGEALQRGPRQTTLSRARAAAPASARRADPGAAVRGRLRRAVAAGCIRGWGGGSGRQGPGEDRERRRQGDRAGEPKDKGARGRGKGSGQKKQLYEVLRMHKTAEDTIVSQMRKQNSGHPSLAPRQLRAMSEENSSVYHFYLDFVNYCCPSHMAQSDEQQWESLGKALKKQYEKEFGANQNQKPPQPQRPNNTLGDFIPITIDTNSKAAKKGVKPARGGGRVGGGPGRGRGDKKDPST
ncbi:unnamed protein product [Prorocentrum cordatum]|uniref:Uncharacterized protein n=1 Tax=Prorocentrum cordatum TaxID=2364126 RepID=A0ABN9PVX7_9DINO|nr:unnamed protein product [Polarella glacialis]